MKLNKTLITGLAGFAALTASAIAVSAPSNYIDTIYYSDASHTNMVGESVLYCTGRHRQTGQVTAYYTIESEPC
ncbi:DUF6289 family protein [Dyella sp.]|jgi:hypothetical protein|uniref:DUF6289 family protein n=1 Tax=Dyella sp. TaxID=1869338 RepID=UPI002D792E9F|nr:DUF6289 family protein [Dyella sp.]HET6432651.1 DUF6289 family protein [Dyella sp.]